MLNFNLRVVLVSALFTGLAINAYACGDDGGGNSGPACTAFQTSSCFCSTGQQGNQQCLADGSGFSDCICGQGGTGGTAGFAGTGGTGGVGGGTECSGGETCVRAPIGGLAFCGQPGATLPASCATVNEACGPSGGTCQALSGIMGCYKPCTPAAVCTASSTMACSCNGGGQGVQTCLSDGSAWGTCNCGTAGTGGVSGTGGTGVSGTGGTGGVSGTGGTGGMTACPSSLSCEMSQFGTFCSAPSPLPGVIPALPPMCASGPDCTAMGLNPMCTMVPMLGSFCLQPCTP